MGRLKSGLRDGWQRWRNLSIPQRFAGGMAVLLVLAASAYIGMFVWLASVRVGYAFELEWMEGGSVDHVRRILEGKALYVEPTLDFVPYIYTPFYYYLSAGVAKLTGLGFTPLRLVSAAASLGIMGLSFDLVKRETQSDLASLVTAGMFAATFRLSGAWLDVARVDTVFVFLLLAALSVFYRGRTVKTAVLAGALFTLAVFTKQAGLVAGVPILVYAILLRTRRALAFLVSAMLGIGATAGWFEWSSQGWFSYYILTIPSNHILLPEWFGWFWTRDVFGALPVAAVLGLFELFARPFVGKNQVERFGLPMIGVALLGVAWSTRVHSGMFDNVNIPAHALLAIAFGLAIHRIIQLVENADARVRVGACYALLLCVAQLAALVYKPLDFVPKSRAKRGGEAFITFLKTLPPRTYVPNHGYLPSLAGKPAFAHWMAVYDVLRDNRDDVSKKLRAHIKSSLAEKRFEAVVVDNNRRLMHEFMQPLKKNYRGGPRVPAKIKHMGQVTGFRTRPALTYLPRPATSKSKKNRPLLKAKPKRLKR